MNTLKLVEYLEHEGIDPKHARAITHSINEAVNEHAASKQDLKDAKNEILQAMKDLQIKLMFLFGAGFITTLGFLFGLVKYFGR